MRQLGHACAAIIATDVQKHQILLGAGFNRSSTWFHYHSHTFTDSSKATKLKKHLLLNIQEELQNEDMGWCFYDHSSSYNLISRVIVFFWTVLDKIDSSSCWNKRFHPTQVLKKRMRNGAGLNQTTHVWIVQIISASLQSKILNELLLIIKMIQILFPNTA